METKIHIEPSKKSIRSKVLQIRNQMPQKERDRAALLVTERLLGHQWFYGSNQILCFSSFGSEIQTIELIREALRRGKKVFLPKIEGCEMVFYKIGSSTELVPGYKGILEPEGTSEGFCYKEEEASRTLMIMPGVAFDPMHRRIGYGKGYYDRYLAGKDGLCIRTIAIGFACQMVEEIPEEEQDIRPYQLLLL